MFRSRVLAADAERDSAAAALTEHYAAGRLLLPEFEERVAGVYRARTRGELARSFRRLPDAGAHYRAVALGVARATSLLMLRLTWFVLRKVMWPLARLAVRAVTVAAARVRLGGGVHGVGR